MHININRKKACFLKYEQVNDIDFIHFVVEIPENGYYWAEELGHRVLLDPPTKREGEIKAPFLLSVETQNHFIKQPLQPQHDKDEPLFIKFAQLDETKDAFLFFSNNFGPLLRPSHKLNYNYFKKEHCDIKATVLLWNLIKMSNNGKNPTEAQQSLNILKKLFLWDNNKLYFTIPTTLEAIYEESHYFKVDSIIIRNDAWLHAWQWALTRYNQIDNSSYTIPIRGIIFEREESHHQDTKFIKQTDPNDTILIAQYVLSRIINAKIFVYPVTPSLLFENKHKYRQTLYPSSLLSAMWMQLLQAFTGERKYRQCDLCHKWADVTDGRENWNRHTSCASTARSKKFRKNKKEGE